MVDLNMISIPFWSDFNDVVTDVSNELQNLFQSHFGLILTEEIKETIDSFESFQSHFGLILTITEGEYAADVNPISIPFWSDFNKN